MQRQRIPGLSLAVIKDGAIIKAAGYGVADTRLKTPAQAETVYKIASVSKQFIATGIMLLIQERQIGLDEPINKNLEGAPAAWEAITIRHLLTHTSGLVREAPGFDPFKGRVMPMYLRALIPYRCALHGARNGRMGMLVTMPSPRSSGALAANRGLST
jgi:CubicO group peptidase (beta-lactamase class C family)